MRKAASDHPHQNTWKEPTQARGRARANTILDAARSLAVEAGSLDFKLSDVAKRAKVPIGSVYQYFPTRTVLVSRLFMREMEAIDESLKRGLSKAASVEDIIDGVGDLIRSHVALVHKRPGLFVIWSTPMFDTALQEADLENSLRNAEAISQKIMALQGEEADREAVQSTALLICHLWGSVIRLGVLMKDADPEGAIIGQYIAMVTAHLRLLLNKGP